MLTSDINFPNLAQLSYARKDIDKRLAGTAGDKPVCIIGSGPSAKDFDPDAHVGQRIIVINGAVREFWWCADVWVAVEENVWAWDWSVCPEFQGQRVLATGAAERIPDEVKEAYSRRQWYNNTCWTQRVNYQGQPLTEQGFGLIQVAGRGGSGLCALHVAEVMKAGSGQPTETWGMEFYFPQGQAQHFYGDSPYQEGDTIVSLCTFDVRDGKGIVGPGPYYSTPFFVVSANAIRFVAQKAGIELIDHSGGLLDIEKFLEVNQ